MDPCGSLWTCLSLEQNCKTLWDVQWNPLDRQTRSQGAFACAEGPKRQSRQTATHSGTFQVQPSTCWWHSKLLHQNHWRGSLIEQSSMVMVCLAGKGLDNWTNQVGSRKLKTGGVTSLLVAKHQPVRAHRRFSCTNLCSPPMPKSPSRTSWSQYSRPWTFFPVLDYSCKRQKESKRSMMRSSCISCCSGVVWSCMVLGMSWESFVKWSLS